MARDLIRFDMIVTLFISVVIYIIIITTINIHQRYIYVNTYNMYSCLLLVYIH